MSFKLDIETRLHNLYMTHNYHIKLKIHLGGVNNLFSAYKALTKLQNTWLQDIKLKSAQWGIRGLPNGARQRCQ